MTAASSLFVRDFLKQIASRRPDRLTSYLDEAVIYEVNDRLIAEGRRALVQLWRRKFQTYAEIGIFLRRYADDGDVVLAHQRHVLASRARPPIIVDGFSTYELQENRLVAWRTYVDVNDISPDEQERLRRLEFARW